MKMGVKTKNGKVFCKNCAKELKMTVPDNIFNFCPHCANPLNLVSYNLSKEKEKIIKLQTINEIKNIITDETDLKKLIYLINKISKI